MVHKNNARQCSVCNKQISLTFSTLFEVTKRKLTTLTLVENVISNWTKRHLFPAISVLSDGLNCFPAVKDAGCNHHVTIKSHIAKTQRYSEFKWIDTMIGNVKNSIHGPYHTIGEKHVPRYLAEFCCHFNRRFELGKMIKQLAQAAINTLQIPQRILKLAGISGN